MTTILADARLGLMVSDSNLSDGDRAWSARKVHRINGALVGLAGYTAELEAFIWWFKRGMVDYIKFNTELSVVLVLKDDGLWIFDDNATVLQKVKSGVESIGTGSKACIAAYDAMKWATGPCSTREAQQAVRIACKHDAQSRAPIRTYRFKGSA